MEPSTVLFLAANPVRLQWLQLGEECRAIEEKIRAAKFRDRLRFRSRWAARPDDLLQALNEDTPTVLHFSGHGDVDQGLCFQAEDGSARSVSADGLAKVMQAAGSSVVVVLLNACYSEMQAQTLSAHIPCVIGMSGALGDEAAVVYATSFYRALAFGKSVANAHEQGVAALALATNGGASRDVESPNVGQRVLGPTLLTRPDVDANCIYVVQRPTEKTRCTIIIKATLREFNSDVLARVTEELRQWTGDLFLQITDIDEGSVRLTVKLSLEATKILAEAKASGQLTHLGGFRVTDVVAASDAEVEARSAVPGVVQANRDRVGLYQQRFAGEFQLGAGQPVPGFADRYRVVRLIGTGGMGRVYEADDIGRGQKVALKTISHFDDEKIYQLKREFRAVAKLSHPNLVALYDLVVADDACFFTMELLDGVDLLTYLWGRKVESPAGLTSATLTAIRVGFEGVDDDADHATLKSPPSTPCDIDRLRHALPQLAHGLHALHAAGKVHRDVKPSNIQVTNDGRVVLLDFGLAAELGHQQGAYGMIVGTVAYMAPEQCAGDVQLTAAVDWYSLGVVLFQALTGRLPFEGVLSRVLFKKQTEAAPRPSLLVQHIPRDLDDLCAELLARAPADRPTGAQVLHRLEVAESSGGAQD